MQLPYDYPPPQFNSNKAKTIQVQLEQGLTKKLRAAVQAEGVTLYTYLLAAFQTQLYSQTGQDDISVTSYFHNRTDQQFYHTVGFLAEAILIRTKVCKSRTFRDHLQQVQADLHATIECQAYPLPLLQERLNIQREPTYYLFPAAYFAYINYYIFPEMADLYATNDIKQVDFAGLCVERFDPVTEFEWESHSGYAMNIMVLDNKHDLSLRVFTTTLACLKKQQSRACLIAFNLY